MLDGKSGSTVQCDMLMILLNKVMLTLSLL